MAHIQTESEWQEEMSAKIVNLYGMNYTWNCGI